LRLPLLLPPIPAAVAGASLITMKNDPIVRASRNLQAAHEGLAGYDRRAPQRFALARLFFLAALAEAARLLTEPEHVKTEAGAE
jgi:hypothetical protein